ncbi:MAG: type II secretion system protein [Candidatus Woesebacteria bacterium]|nr:type II secretion system protein [Candidatus Woesebacteria bacterium]
MKKNKGFSLINRVCEGFSLIEILIVISIFSVVGILSTRAILLTMRGAKKSDSQVRVRENVNYALSVIERQIRSSESVTCTASTTILNYVSLEGTSATFSCVTAGTDKYIASGSARLTSGDIVITSCSFDCTQADQNKPPIVKVSIVAEDATKTSIEK